MNPFYSLEFWGNRDEAVELQNVLSKITNKDFNILIVNFKEGISNIVEQNWRYRGFVQLNSHVIRIDGKVMIPIGMLF